MLAGVKEPKLSQPDNRSADGWSWEARHPYHLVRPPSLVWIAFRIGAVGGTILGALVGLSFIPFLQGPYLTSWLPTIGLFVLGGSVGAILGGLFLAVIVVVCYEGWLMLRRSKMKRGVLSPMLEKSERAAPEVTAVVADPNAITDKQ